MEIEKVLGEYKEQGFNTRQLLEIGEGIKSGVDVSKYAYKNIGYRKMELCRGFLEQGVDICEYAKAGYEWEQLLAIGKGLKIGVELDGQISPKMSSEKIRALCLELENGKREDKKEF